MTKKPEISMHFGAAHDDITVDGSTFTRHKLTRADFTSMRRIVVGVLERIGYFRRSKKGVR